MWSPGGDHSLFARRQARPPAGALRPGPPCAPDAEAERYLRVRRRALRSAWRSLRFLYVEYAMTMIAPARPP